MAKGKVALWLGSLALPMVLVTGISFTAISLILVDEIDWMTHVIFVAMVALIQVGSHFLDCVYDKEPHINSIVRTEGSKVAKNVHLASYVVFISASLVLLAYLVLNSVVTGFDYILIGFWLIGFIASFYGIGRMHSVVTCMIAFGTVPIAGYYLQMGTVSMQIVGVSLGLALSWIGLLGIYKIDDLFIAEKPKEEIIDTIRGHMVLVLLSAFLSFLALIFL